MKVSLPNETATYAFASQLGVELQRKGKHSEAKVVYLAALEGRRRVLRGEDKYTLSSLNTMENVFQLMKDFEGSLDYYQQALRGKYKVSGKTHPDTLRTVMNMANAYQDVTKDFTKAEEMYMLALDGYERSLGKEHKRTKECAKN